MTAASLVPGATRRIGPGTQRCSVPGTKGGSVRALPSEKRSLLVTQRFGGIDPRGLAGREEGREQRGHVGEGDDHAQGAPWHLVTDTGDLLREGVDYSDREGGAKRHAETDTKQGDERRLYEESEPYLPPLEPEGAQHPDLLPPLDHGAGCDNAEGRDTDEETQTHEAHEQVVEESLRGRTVFDLLLYRDGLEAVLGEGFLEVFRVSARIHPFSQPELVALHRYGRSRQVIHRRARSRHARGEERCVFEHPDHLQVTCPSGLRVLDLYVEVVRERCFFPVEAGELYLRLPLADVEVGSARRKVGGDHRGILLGPQRTPHLARRVVLGDGGLETVADVLRVAAVHALQEEGLRLAVRVPLLGVHGEPGDGADRGVVAFVEALRVLQGLVHVGDRGRVAGVGAHVEASGEPVRILEDGAEGGIYKAHGHYGKDDEGEHGEGHARTEAALHRVGYGGLEDGRHPAQPAEQDDDRAEQEVGVVDYDPHTGEHDHDARDKEEVYTFGHPARREREGQKPEPEQEHAGHRKGDPLRHPQHAGDERGPDYEKGEAEHVHARLLDLEALPYEAGPGERGREREEDAFDAAALFVGLGDVADGPYYVKATHPPGRDEYDRERQHHAEAECYNHVFGARGEGDRKPRARECFADHTHHQPSDTDAGDAPEGAREQGVESPLEGEHAHQVTPAHPDGAGYPELVLALRSEHHEDQEDQEHAGGHGELPEEQEDIRERLPAIIGLLYSVLLDGLGFEILILEERI